MAKRPTRPAKTLEEYETSLQMRQSEEKFLTSLLKWHKAQPLTEEETLAALTGKGELPDWMSDILFLLDEAQALTLGDLCRVVGTNRRLLMKWRRKHPSLESACRDYLAATFEEEMELPQRGIRPGILTSAAEKIIPTFSKNQDGMLSEEDAALLVRTILDSLRTRLAATKLAQEIQEICMQGIAGDIRHEFAKRNAE